MRLPSIEGYRPPRVKPDFVSEMLLGQETIKRRDMSAASRHLRRAHGFGHGNSAQHLAVHRALLVAAWKSRNLRRIALNPIPSPRWSF